MEIEGQESNLENLGVNYERLKENVLYVFILS